MTAMDALARAHQRATLFNRILAAVGGWHDHELDTLAKALSNQRTRGVYEAVTTGEHAGTRVQFHHPDGSPAEDLPPVAYVCHPVAARPREVVCIRCGQTAVEPDSTGCPRCRVIWSTSPTEIAHANAQRARRWWGWLARSPRFAWTAPWIINVEEWLEADDAHRRRGLRDDVAIISRFDLAVLVGGRVSSGMRTEALGLLASGGAAYDLSYLGPEPPQDRGPEEVEWVPWRAT